MEIFIITESRDSVVWMEEENDLADLKDPVRGNEVYNSWLWGRQPLTKRNDLHIHVYINIIPKTTDKKNEESKNKKN